MPSSDESSDEWDTVVKRISERMRSPAEPAPRPSRAAAAAPAPSSAQDMTGDLTRLEARALEAEAALASEREAYNVRVQEMQDKLRKIEPWIRKLKGEYETACKERDGLHAKLKRVKSRSSETEVQALQTELQAARVAKEAARAELSAMRRQVESDRASLQEAWQARIATAEKARDQAIEELGVARRSASDAREHEEQVKRLRKDAETLETAAAAHKAVARAAQEQQERLQARVTELEKAVSEGEARSRAKSSETQEHDQQVKALEKKLHRVIQSLEEARSAAENYELRIAEVDAAARDANIERDEAVRAREAKDIELESARNKLAGLQQNIISLKARVTKAEQAAEGASAKDERVEELQHELDGAREELRTAKERVDTLEREGQNLGEAAAATEVELRKRLTDFEARAEEHAEAVARSEREISDERSRAERAEHELATALRDLETARGTLLAIETENRTLNESLATVRSQSAEALETNERTWRAEIDAVEQRMGAESERYRALAERAEDRAAALALRLQAASQARGVELVRLRDEIPLLVRTALDQVVSGFESTFDASAKSALRSAASSPEALAGGDAHRVPTTEPPAEAPSEVDDAPPDLDSVLPDWEQVLSDVEALSHEVNGLTPNDYDTADVEQNTETGAATSAADQARDELELGFDLAPGSEARANRGEISEIEEALEAARDQDDSEHAQNDTCTIDAGEVTGALFDAAAADSDSVGELDLSDGDEVDASAPDEDDDEGNGDEGDAGDGEGAPEGAASSDPLPRRRRRRRRK